MKLYTKRGDAGQTDLFGGARVAKSHPRVMAYGAIDAANSAIGFVYACDTLPESIKILLPTIMSDLFDVGAELATAPIEGAHDKLKTRLDSNVNMSRISELESFIDSAEEQLSPLKSFVLPTGCDAAARLHLARTAIRYAEQQVVGLMEIGEFVQPEALAYVNRLSDLLFVWARLSNHLAGVPDVLWLTRK